MILTKLSPRLSHQGIILVSLPLAFELFFVFALMQMLSAAEQQANKSEQSRAIINEATMVAINTYDCINSLTCYSSTDNKAWAQRYEQGKKQVGAHLSSLRELIAKRSAEEKRIARRFDHAAQSGSKIFDLVKQKLDDGDKMFAAATANKFQGDDNEIARMALELEALGKAVDTHKSVEAEQKLRERIGVFLCAGVLVNFIIAFALVAYFNRATISRLLVLMENTKRLGRKEKLNPLLSGTDEIAELDKVFHKMADSLQELDRRKQEFVSMVSHDLRTPLTAILGTVALLERGSFGNLNDTGKTRVQGMEGSIRQLIKLINDLLDIDKLESGKLELFLETVRLPDLIERAVEAVRSFAEQKQVRLEARADDLEFKGDGDRLLQVLVNLLANAVKFSPAGSTVTIFSRQEADYLEINVEDHGRGIPQEHISAVFDRFRQLKKGDAQEKGGSGLGLTICKAIIEQHGGKIGVESEEGKGSRFWFRLKRS